MSFPDLNRLNQAKPQRLVRVRLVVGWGFLKVCCDAECCLVSIFFLTGGPFINTVKPCIHFQSASVPVNSKSQTFLLSKVLFTSELVSSFNEFCVTRITENMALWYFVRTNTAISSTFINQKSTSTLKSEKLYMCWCVD